MNDTKISLAFHKQQMEGLASKYEERIASLEVALRMLGGPQKTIVVDTRTDSQIIADNLKTKKSEKVKTHSKRGLFGFNLLKKFSTKG